MVRQTALPRKVGSTDGTHVRPFKRMLPNMMPQGSFPENLKADRAREFLYNLLLVFGFVDFRARGRVQDLVEEALGLRICRERAKTAVPECGGVEVVSGLVLAFVVANVMSYFLRENEGHSAFWAPEK